METTTNLSLFEVGKLDELYDYAGSTPESALIDKLLTFDCFAAGVDAHFVGLMKRGLPEIINRVGIAIDSLQEGQPMNEEIWAKLCDEPKNRLRFDELWYVDDKKKAYLKTLEEKVQEHANRLMEAIYYCVFVVALWRHPRARARYELHAISFSTFYQRYSTNPEIMTTKDYGMACINFKKAEWLKLFWYRNVFILTSAISPYPRQKGLFMKIASILVEGRIHSTGGGQSFAANRIAFLYAIEGASYNCELVRKRYRPSSYTTFVPYRTEKLVTVTGQVHAFAGSSPGSPLSPTAPVSIGEAGGRTTPAGTAGGSLISVPNSGAASAIAVGIECGSAPGCVDSVASSGGADQLIKTFLEKRQHQQAQRLQRKQFVGGVSAGEAAPPVVTAHADGVLSHQGDARDSVDAPIGESPHKKLRTSTDIAPFVPGKVATGQPMNVNMFYHNLNQCEQGDPTSSDAEGVSVGFPSRCSYSDLSAMSGSTDMPYDGEASSVSSDISGDDRFGVETSVSTITTSCGDGVGKGVVHIIQQFHKPVIPEPKQKKLPKEPKPPKESKIPKPPKMSAKEVKRLAKEADDRKVAEMLLALAAPS